MISLQVDPIIAAIAIGIWIRMEQRMLKFERTLYKYMDRMEREMTDLREDMELKI
jgi:hypothetical protein